MEHSIKLEKLKLDHLNFCEIKCSQSFNCLFVPPVGLQDQIEAEVNQELAALYG